MGRASMKAKNLKAPTDGNQMYMHCPNCMMELPTNDYNDGDILVECTRPNCRVSFERPIARPRTLH
jgi:hypothetical protein